MKTNGPLELTPDAIKANGLNVADHIRELGKKARAEAEQVEQFAEQVSQAITEATSQVADRVSWLLENCQAARESMEQHKALLTKLPDKKTPATPVREAGIEAVTKSLDDLEKALAPEDNPKPRMLLGPAKSEKWNG